MNSIKNKILGTLKTKKYVEKGEDTCRNAKAVQDIFDDKKLSFDKKLDLINRYIPGIKSKVKNNNNFELMEHKNFWLDLEIKLCKEYMASIGVDNPLKIKKFVSNMLKLKDIEIVVTPSPKTFYEDKPKPRRRSSVGSVAEVKSGPGLMAKSNSIAVLKPRNSNVGRASSVKPRNSNVGRASLLEKSDSDNSIPRSSNVGRTSKLARSNSVSSPIRYSVMMADTLSESSPIKK